MTEDQLEEMAASLRAEHHSKWTWTHELAQMLLAEVRYLREHLENAEHDRDTAVARVEKLESAIRKVVRHQPWPCSPAVERDFAEAGMLVPEKL